MNDDPSVDLNVGSLEGLFTMIRLFLRANSSIHSPLAHVLLEFQRVLFEFMSPAMTAVERWAPSRGEKIWAGIIGSLFALLGLGTYTEKSEIVASFVDILAAAVFFEDNCAIMTG